MPDWERLVAERLGHLKLPPEERREVIVEIAAHLEECYQGLRDAGSPDPEGYTLAQVRDWNALCRKIRRAKEGRMSFAWKVIMPGLAALFLAQIALSLSLRALAPLVGKPIEVHFHVDASHGAFYYPWLLTLPLAGALGAWLARRAGASTGQRLAAALFPAIFVVVVSTLFGVVALVSQRLFSEFKLANQATVFLYWVIAPAIACAIGAWPFLSGKSQQTANAPPSDAARA